MRPKKGNGLAAANNQPAKTHSRNANPNYRAVRHNTPPSKITALARIRDRHPGVSCAAQRDRLREALSRYAVTTFEGMRYLDCYDTRKRIQELRDQGEKIDTHPVVIVTESGETHRVGMYVLDSTVRTAYLGKGAL